MPDFRQQLVELLPRLRRFAFALTRSAHDAEDVVQAAVERALLHAESWRQGTRLDSWMYRIIQNLWRDELRAHRRKAESLDSAAEIVGVDGRIETAAQADLEDARAALLKLPEEQRAVFIVVVLDGMSYQEAADTLQIPIGTVMSRLARARATLAATLGHSVRRLKAAKS
jgi:RNA polymerase sigma-70 factor (ECF subfamily)